jgi:GTPase SAR1 family protein
MTRLWRFGSGLKRVSVGNKEERTSFMTNRKGREEAGVSSRGIFSIQVETGAMATRLRQTYRRLEKKQFPEMVIDALKPIVDSMEELEFRLAVVGAFSRGKTAFLNALIGEDVLFSDLEPTTAVVTEICYGASISVRAWDNSNQCIEQHHGIDLSKAQDLLANFSTFKNKTERGQYSRVRFSYPSDRLVKGLVLVDTPGIESIIRDHDDITKREIDRSDGIIFVSCIDPPIGDREKVFYEAYIKSYEKTLLIINKIDLVEYDPRDIEKAVNYVSKHLKLPPNVIVPMSARDALRKSSLKYQEMSGLISLSNKVRSVILTEGPYNTKLRKVMNQLEEAIAEIDNALVIENRLIDHADLKELETMIRSLEEGKVRQKKKLSAISNQVKHEILNLKKTLNENASKLVQETKTSISSGRKIEDIQKTIENHQKEMESLCNKTNKQCMIILANFCEVAVEIRVKEMRLLVEKFEKRGLNNFASVTVGLGGTAVGAGVYTSFAATATLMGSTGLASFATSLGLGAICITTLPSLLSMTGVGLVVGIPIGLGAHAYLNKRKLKKCQFEATERIESWSKEILDIFLRSIDGKMDYQIKNVQKSDLDKIQNNIENAAIALKEKSQDIISMKKKQLSVWKTEKNKLNKQLQHYCAF